jgi:hypothetical protein
MPLEREMRPNWDIVEVTPLLDLDDLVGIIKRRLPWLIAIPVICVALALSYAFFIATPLYRSTALVFVDPMFDRTLQIQPSGAGMSDLDSLNSLEKAIMSDSMVLRVIDKLERMGLTDLRKHVVFEHCWTPLDIREQYRSNKGSIYGVVSDRFRNLAFKAPKQSVLYPNLFFVGGSVNPGGGMPMVVLCGQNVAKNVAAWDRGH